MLIYYSFHKKCRNDTSSKTNTCIYITHCRFPIKRSCQVVLYCNSWHRYVSLGKFGTPPPTWCWVGDSGVHGGWGSKYIVDRYDWNELIIASTTPPIENAYVQSPVFRTPCIPFINKRGRLAWKLQNKRQHNAMDQFMLLLHGHVWFLRCAVFALLTSRFVCVYSWTFLYVGVSSVDTAMNMCQTNQNTREMPTTDVTHRVCSKMTQRNWFAHEKQQLFVSVYFFCVQMGDQKKVPQFQPQGPTLRKCVRLSVFTTRRTLLSIY